MPTVTKHLQQNKHSYSCYLRYYFGSGQPRPKVFLGLNVSQDYLSPLQDKRGNTKYKSNGKPAYPKILPEDVAAMEAFNAAYLKARAELAYESVGLISKLNQEQNFVKHLSDMAFTKKNRSWTGCARKVENFSGGRRKISLVTEDWLLDFVDYCVNGSDTDKPISYNSAITYLKRMKIAWNNLVRKGRAEGDPFKPVLDSLKRKSQNPETIFLDRRELRLLIESANAIRKSVVAGFLFSCFTGLRYSDVSKITWKNIEPDDNSNVWLRFRQQKASKKDLRIPLSNEALRILDKQRGRVKNENRKIFGSLPSNTICNRELKRWAKAAGIPKELHFHVGRHTYATSMLRSGASLYMVSKFLGHESIKQTEKYAKIVGIDMVESIGDVNKYFEKIGDYQT